MPTRVIVDAVITIPIWEGVQIVLRPLLDATIGRWIDRQMDRR